MPEGAAELTEEKPGVYSYNGTYGFDGVPAGGAAKIDLSKENGKCTLKISAGKGAQQISRSFAWKMDSSGIPESIAEVSSQDGSCRFKLRYSKSFAQCLLPTSTEPGAQCHGEGGKDLTAFLLSGNPAVKRKLVAYSGGMTIEVDPRSQNGISVWRNPKEEKSWCYELKTLFPSQCTKLSSRQEIKNSAGQIIGVLEVQEERVLFKQAKQPYKENGYEIDASAPAVRLTNSKAETNVAVLGENNAETGRLTVLGNIDLPRRFSSYNKPPLNILDGNTIQSDCNGVLKSGDNKESPNQKDSQGGAK